MGFIEGEARTQGALFPRTLEEMIPDDHFCRVIDAFVERLDMQELGFVRAEAAETGRPGYDPRDLLKLYLYGYLQQIRSSRRLESECRRNLELRWLLGRLCPDHKSIAEFRRMHRNAVTHAGAELVKWARSVGLIRGEWIAIDGSKFRAVSSISSVQERASVERYLESLETADREYEPIVENSAVVAALEKLRSHSEPEAGFMKTTQGMVPAYNVQTAVDAEHGLIVAQQVTDEANDTRSLLPMAEAAQQAVGDPTASMHVVADAGYSNGEQAAACESKGILPHVPAHRGVNTQGGGKLFDRTAFHYQEQSNTMLCPAGHSLRSDGRNKRAIVYVGRPEVCGACALKSQCTVSPRRIVRRHVHEGALQRMKQRATPAAMQLRRRVVEHPFAILKYVIFGHPRFLLRGLNGTRVEISLAVMAYNLKRMLNLMGATALRAALATI
jgi:transposase/IS5 family transposase